MTNTTTNPTTDVTGVSRELADFGVRVQGALVDWIAPFLGATVIGSAIPALFAILNLAAFGWVLYNAHLQGATGQSYGKRWAGTELVSEETGQHIGGGAGIIRYLAHIVDSMIFGVGYLFPLWDEKRQTLADKITKTLVVKV